MRCEHFDSLVSRCNGMIEWQSSSQLCGANVFCQQRDSSGIGPFDSDVFFFFAFFLCTSIWLRACRCARVASLFNRHSWAIFALNCIALRYFELRERSVHALSNLFHCDLNAAIQCFNYPNFRIEMKIGSKRSHLFHVEFSLGVESRRVINHNFLWHFQFDSSLGVSNFEQLDKYSIEMECTVRSFSISIELWVMLLLPRAINAESLFFVNNVDAMRAVDCAPFKLICCVKQLIQEFMGWRAVNCNF